MTPFPEGAMGALAGGVDVPKIDASISFKKTESRLW